MVSLLFHGGVCEQLAVRGLKSPGHWLRRAHSLRLSSRIGGEHHWQGGWFARMPLSSGCTRYCARLAAELPSFKFASSFSNSVSRISNPRVAVRSGPRVHTRPGGVRRSRLTASARTHGRRRRTQRPPSGRQSRGTHGRSSSGQLSQLSGRPPNFEAAPSEPAPH